MQNPRHIAITGASSGIGAALAELYASPDIRLSLHGRDAPRLATVAETVRQRGATVTTAAGDVTDPAAMAQWIASCNAAAPIDLLIANAGISGGSGTGALETDAQSRAIFAVNLDGVLNTVHPALPLMLARRQGQIAIMSSLAGFRGLGGAASYGGSKAAVRVYGEALRGALATRGIEVNVICPGFIKTPMTDANPFPMPFIMNAERAACIIRKGLEKNRSRIVFPWVMATLVWLLATLPPAWTDSLLALAPRKPALAPPK